MSNSSKSCLERARTLSVSSRERNEDTKRYLQFPEYCLRQDVFRRCVYVPISMKLLSFAVSLPRLHGKYSVPDQFGALSNIPYVKVLSTQWL